MNPDPVAFQVFGQNIYWYGILISTGILLGIILAMRNAKVFGLDQDAIVDLALLIIPLAIVGARLYYVVFEWDQYKGNILDIVNIRKGGLAIYGGVIGGVIAGLIFARWKKLDFWNLADICAPSLILGQAIGRWGNYINQEAYGYAVRNPEWQWFPASVFIDANQQWHLATFFYEAFWNFIVFFLLMSYRKHRKKTGEVFLLYLILYSVGRFFIEGLRTDSLYLGSIRVSQLLSAILFVGAILMFIYRRKQSPAEEMDAAGMAGDASVVEHENIFEERIIADYDAESEETAGNETESEETAGNETESVETTVETVIGEESTEESVEE
ncbi:MAG: prolipoprotein diacylglyceryl transferase [Clostridiales bacterium]|nr:prolipoprotein diacylglyceryl transferase [Clostridiales bacterium]